MAARTNVRTKSRPPIHWWRYAVSIGLLCLLAMSFVFGVHQLERFLISDPRFALALPTEYAGESPNLHVEGIQYASRDAILRIFRPDVGRSVFLLPLTDRWKAVSRVPWVKTAAVSRDWPNQITIRITERQPAAFLQVPAEGMSRWSLIDDEGYILDPPLKSTFDLPVLTGASSRDELRLRAEKVHRMQRLMDDLGSLKQQVSEVDAADLDNLKIMVKMNDRAVRLMLGDHNYRIRLQTFLDRFEEIRKRTSNTSVVDMRVDNHIYVLGGKHAN